LRSVNVNGTYKAQSHTVPFVVVKDSGLTLMGHNWLQVFNFDWQESFLLQNSPVSPVQKILQKHPDAFQEGLGTLSGFKSNVIVDPSAQSKYYKPCTVPYFLCDKVEKKLNCLVTS